MQETRDRKSLIQPPPGSRLFGPEVRKVLFLLNFSKKCGISRFRPPETQRFARETRTFQKWTILERLLRKKRNNREIMRNGRNYGAQTIMIFLRETFWQKWWIS